MKSLNNILNFLIALTLVLALLSCNTTKKSISRLTSTAHITDSIISDSSFSASTDSVRVKKAEATLSNKVDSVYDSRIIFEEEIEYKDSAIKKIKRKTTIEDKGRYVFESLEKFVKADSINVHNQVNVIKRDLKIKDSSFVINSYTKDVQRKKFPFWIIVFAFLFFVFLILRNQFKL